ncbi:MAG: hypothetical protein JNK82_08850 [Myxococcaceae bacterium]|nr:hypothetical protein [Myxococcaceae bacterium]
MFPRLVSLGLLLSAGAFAQDSDLDGDGDIDADDWQAVAPPLPEDDGSSDWAQWPAEQAPAQAPTQAQFEAQLSPYGAWYEEPGVGRVWQPAPAVVGGDFVPYTTGGQWVATTGGWQFATTYGFGSMPYHYGRWHRSPRYGWVWWPHTQWAPAWVDWRYNSMGNVAWAPLAPPGFSVRFSTGAPAWSFAYGRYRRPYVQSFSWGRYGGWHRGYVGRNSGGYRGYGGYRGGYDGYRGYGGYRGGGGYGGGYRRGGGGGYHHAQPANPGRGGGGGRGFGRGRGR